MFLSGYQPLLQPNDRPAQRNLLFLNPSFIRSSAMGLKITAAITLAASLYSNPARAQTETDESANTLDPIVITANRVEQQSIDVPARISVITREEIERSQAPDLLELLRLEAGVDSTRSGGPGGQTSVFLRGSNSNHVLVLIDGVRVAASGTGAFTWEILDPALIERIEIVRGPRAARWGSDAIGGVIQIFTLRPDTASARVRFGSDQDYAGSFAWGRQSGDTPLDLAISGRRTDGFSAQNENGFAFNPDDDGFENVNLSSGGSFSLGQGRLNWRGRLATGEIEFDQGVSDFENASLRLDYQHQTRGPWQWHASAAVLHDELDTENAFDGSRVETRRIQADWLAERSIGTNANWLIGLDGWTEDGESRGDWSEERQNFGLFTGLDGQHDALGYEVSLRLDDNEFYGTELTGNLGLNWQFNEQFRAFVSAGRGFRAPTFSQLFSPGFQFSPGGDFFFGGNPNLEPERSWSLELGTDWTPWRNHRFHASVYSNWIEDLVDFSGINSQAINVNEARIQGIEIGHVYSGQRWSSDFNATWQDPEDRELDRDLLRRATAKYNWTVGHRFDAGHTVDVELAHVGNRLDVGSRELASYTLVNVSAALQWRRHWHAEVRIDNLADREYEPIFGFNAPDRTFWLALAWRQ